jgi:hypothetical protein
MSSRKTLQLHGFEVMLATMTLYHTNGTIYIAIAEHLLSKNQSDQAENNVPFPEV